VANNLEAHRDRLFYSAVPMFVLKMRTASNAIDSDGTRR
jgi:hypothetical protein